LLSAKYNKIPSLILSRSLAENSIKCRKNEQIKSVQL
jgi:hypothetical protein